MKDIFYKDASSLREKKLWLFDMDGTIYEENRVFEGTRELLSEIKRNDGKYVFITNNSSKSVKDYIKKLTLLGIEADEENFFTSTQASILYIKKNFPEALVYVEVTKSCIEELIDAGLNVIEEVNEEASVVLVGFDTELTSEKLRKTCEMLTKRVDYIATNPDLACPVSFGYIPDCGSICQMIENVTGRKPIYIGKPQPIMVEFVREKFGCPKEQVVVVGDRLYTDIATGKNAGVMSVCVLTGEATEEEIIKGEIKPSLTFCSVKEIWEIIRS